MSVKPFHPEFYTDEAGEVRWRVRGTNHEIISASSEGFANLRKAFDNYELSQSTFLPTYEQVKDQDYDSDQEADTDGSSEEAGGSGASSSSEDGEDPGSGGEDPESENSLED